MPLPQSVFPGLLDPWLPDDLIRSFLLHRLLGLDDLLRTSRVVFMFEAASPSKKRPGLYRASGSSLSMQPGASAAMSRAAVVDLPGSSCGR